MTVHDPEVRDRSRGRRLVGAAQHEILQHGLLQAPRLDRVHRLDGLRAQDTEFEKLKHSATKMPKIYKPPSNKNIKPFTISPSLPPPHEVGSIQVGCKGESNFSGRQNDVYTSSQLGGYKRGQRIIGEH